MSDELDDSADKGPTLLQPAFVAAAVVVIVIVLLGVVVAVRVARSGDDHTATASSPTATDAPASVPTVTGSDTTSICGLKGPADAGVGIDEPPLAVWQYEGTTAYPTSQEYGPGRTAPEGYRYCFQKSAPGALFATANAVAQGAASDDAVVGAWADYFVSTGAGRAKILAELNEPRDGSVGVRMSIVGFRLLSYTGSAARVDLALETSGSARTVLASAVYELAWEAGDWKLNSSAPEPFNFSTISGIDGYIPWKA